MSYKCAAATICFKPYTLAEALRGISHAGFEYVELAAMKNVAEHVDPDDLSPAALDGLERALDTAGLTPVSFSGHTELHTEEGAARTQRLLSAAQRLGMLAVNTFTGDVVTNRDRQAFSRNVGVLGDFATRCGVMLCLETDSDMLPTGEAGARVVAELGQPSIRINYDPGNVAYLTERRPEEDIRHALDVLGHVHLKDHRGGIGVHDYPALGDGDLDLGAILAQLREARFDGVVSLEIEYDEVTWPSWEDCLADVQRSWAYWQTLRLKGDELSGNDLP